MSEYDKSNIEIEYDNKGFTLVEVIIAVVIMAIAAIPLLHAFSTTANTSSKALIKLRATNAAENIMEDIKGMDIDEVIKVYGDPSVTYPNYDGKNTPVLGDPNSYIPKKDKNGNPVKAGYEFELTASDAKFNKDINNVLEKGYTATIQIDPTYYPNINAVNLSDFDEVSSAHSAIINVSQTVDDEAVTKFVDLNDGYEGYKLLDAKKVFEKEYKREIRIVVTKKGDPVDIDGEIVTPVEVSTTVSYLLYNNGLHKYVPIGTETQTMLNRKVFNNTTNNNRLNSVIVLYNPLYENADDNRDIIIVHNEDNIEFNLFVIAQNAVGDSWDDYRKKTTGGLILEIYEKEITGDDGVNKQPITLYTNLHNDIHDPANNGYKRTEDSELIPIQCYINLAEPFNNPESKDDLFNDTVYKRVVNKKGKWQEDNTQYTQDLDARDVDGKNLDASRVDDKIYDVRVIVRKDTSDDEWPIEVSLTGTMVRE